MALDGVAESAENASHWFIRTLEDVHDIRTIQDILGDKDASITMIYSMCSTEAEAMWQARLIGYDRLRPTPFHGKLILDIPRSNIWIYSPVSPSIPAHRHLDIDTQETDIADVSRSHGNDSLRDILRAYPRMVSGSLHS